jgi:molecular chaperone GrpE
MIDDDGEVVADGVSEERFSEEESAGAGLDAASQIAELQERVLRSQAELENFRKRSRREYDDSQRYREIDVLRDLLPVLDNVLRAIEASEKTADVESLKSGFRMTAQQLEKLLSSHG